MGFAFGLSSTVLSLLPIVAIATGGAVVAVSMRTASTLVDAAWRAAAALAPATLASGLVLAALVVRPGRNRHCAATLGPHSVILPAATISAHGAVGPASLVMRGELVSVGSRWSGNPIGPWREVRFADDHALRS